jgi:hypothetical protein
MNKYTKTSFAILLSFSIYEKASAEIISVDVEATAVGAYQLTIEEIIGVDVNNTQIDQVVGSRDDGSAGSFDSTSFIDDTTILFKNANGAFGTYASSTSRTSVDITFQNQTNDAIRPVFDSQILAAGMGFYMSDCTAVNLRECGSRDQDDITFLDVTGFAGNLGAAAETSFNFEIVSEGQTLFALTGKLSLILGENGGPNTIVRQFSNVEGFLNNFAETSSLDNQTQISYDWDVTDFEVVFPTDLLPGDSTSVQYITEVTTLTNSNCIESGGLACPVAYGGFGDPVGRRGGGFRFPSDEPINGFEAGLYRMAASFDDGVLSYRAVSGPGIEPVTVPTPPALILLLLAGTFLTLRRK